jgi:hypothetical protein
VGGSQNDHTFDMHGWNDRCDEDAECPVGQFEGTDAGQFVWIHHNTVLAASHPSVVVRGRPDECAWIENNYFAPDSDDAIHVEHVPASIDDRVEPRHNRFGYRGLQFSSAGTLPWQSYLPELAPLASLRFGDWDGDGIDDLLYIRPSDSHWLYYFTKARATGAGWIDFGVRVAGLTAARLAVGDFDGDGLDDLFYTTGSQWKIASHGTGAFKNAAAASDAFASLRFGDFDGDGKTDVFHTIGGQWSMSSGGMGAWQPLQTSSLGIGELRFGDFDGNGKTDVFRSVGGVWSISYDGLSTWTPVGGSSVGLGELRFGDFDGDGKTDVFAVFSGEWRISSGATATWRVLGSSGHALSSFAFADLDGDEATDVVYFGEP